MIKESKFNVLYESVMNELNNVHNSIVRIFNWNESTQSFSDLYSEEINFKFKECTKSELEILKDLTYELDQCEEHNLEDGVYKKVEVTDKETGDLLISFITDNIHLNEIMELLDYYGKY